MNKIVTAGKPLKPVGKSAEEVDSFLAGSPSDAPAEVNSPQTATQHQAPSAEVAKPKATPRKITKGNQALVPALKGTSKLPTYILRIPKSLRNEIRIEAIHADLDMSTYICRILLQRDKILKKK